MKSFFYPLVNYFLNYQLMIDLHSFTEFNSGNLRQILLLIMHWPEYTPFISLKDSSTNVTTLWKYKWELILKLRSIKGNYWTSKAVPRGLNDSGLFGSSQRKRWELLPSILDIWLKVHNSRTEPHRKHNQSFLHNMSKSVPYIFITRKCWHLAFGY